MSCATHGSKIKDVFPEPETPTTKVDSNLLLSGILTALPWSLSVPINISSVYCPQPTDLSERLIPS